MISDIDVPHMYHKMMLAHFNHYKLVEVLDKVLEKYC